MWFGQQLALSHGQMIQCWFFVSNEDFNSWPPNSVRSFASVNHHRSRGSENIAEPKSYLTVLWLPSPCRPDDDHKTISVGKTFNLCSYTNYGSLWLQQPWLFATSSWGKQEIGFRPGDCYCAAYLWVGLVPLATVHCPRSSQQALASDLPAQWLSSPRQTQQQAI